MTATPAWPPQSAPRLHVETLLGEGVAVPIDGNGAHYLISVMRVKPDDIVLLFDGKSGEWAARARDIRKRDLVLECVQQTKPPEVVPDFWLCCAPIKKGRIDLIAEKACELGHLVEAAEQCGRTALPELTEMVKLDALLKGWSAERHLFFADETGGASLDETLRAHPGPAAFLVGPEGGFDPAERDAIRATPGAVPVSLGPRILRAETAAIAATAAWMTVNGDWG
ncbi:MAG: 16S rRNA (uracil(1498)-N(3))-methyltransferase [Sphingobium sp.]|nr:MAG: 16S rRNA (uracil(1498)-N(3))-methyltransferase [Sphingobium sp.]